MLAAATVSLLVDILIYINDRPPDGDKAFHALAMNAEQRVRGEEERPGRLATTEARASDFLALIAMNAVLLQRRLGAPDTKERARNESYLTHLFPRTRVGRALYDVYDPRRQVSGPSMDRTAGGPSQAPKEEEKEKERQIRAWEELDPESFDFYRAGTTSAILCCGKIEAEASAYDQPLILKCVLFPWTLTPAIANSTAGYAETYRTAGPVAVRAEVSSERWVDALPAGIDPRRVHRRRAEKGSERPPPDHARREGRHRTVRCARLPRSSGRIGDPKAFPEPLLPPTATTRQFPMDIGPEDGVSIRSVRSTWSIWTCRPAM